MGFVMRDRSNARSCSLQPWGICGAVFRDIEAVCRAGIFLLSRRILLVCAFLNPRCPFCIVTAVRSLLERMGSRSFQAAEDLLQHSDVKEGG
jgi:hypothetical protein